MIVLAFVLITAGQIFAADVPGHPGNADAPRRAYLVPTPRRPLMRHVEGGHQAPLRHMLFLNLPTAGTQQQPADAAPTPNGAQEQQR